MQLRADPPASKCCVCLEFRYLLLRSGRTLHRLVQLESLRRRGKRCARSKCLAQALLLLKQPIFPRAGRFRCEFNQQHRTW